MQNQNKKKVSREPRTPTPDPHPIHLILFTFFLCLSVQVQAQTQHNVQLHHKIAEQTLYLRWAPQDFTSFQRGIRQGYGIISYALNTNNGQVERRELDRTTIQPLAFAEWQNQHRNNVWDTITFQMVYFDRIDTEVLEENYPIEEDGSDSWEELRWQLSNYAQNFDFVNIERAGFGFRQTLDPAVEHYGFQIFPLDAGAQDTLWFNIEPTKYQPPAVPPLEVVFKDAYADLSFRTAEFERTYFGYTIEKEAAGNTPYFLTDQPFINPYDTAVYEEALKYIYHTDTLAQNDVAVTYRLYGMDYLGGLSQRYAEVTGSGYDEIRFSPLLLGTEQTDSNFAIIRWELDAAYEDLVQEFRIIHTDTVGGEYKAALVGIAPDQREAKVPMAYRSNFYRVQAVPFRGEIKSSFESLILMYDVEPPARPQGLQGQIDSLGIVRLSWQANQEDDLEGYRVFKSLLPQSEFAGITADPLKATTFIDTVSMESGNEWVYYQLRAMDWRGNGSAFTPTLALKKPDVFPPAPARFKAPDENGRRIALQWHPSPSVDATEGRLYRRNLGLEEDWLLLYTYAQDAPAAHRYEDTDIVAGDTYAYTIITTDDDGLESEPTQPVVVQVVDRGVRPPIEDFRAIVLSDTPVVQLSWNYGPSANEFWLYKATGEDALSLLKVINGTDTRFLDEKITAEQTYRYVLRAQFTDGSASPWTEVLEVVVE